MRLNESEGNSIPYIPQADREKLIRKPTLSETPGELNFVITTIILAYLENKGESYENYNAVIGVLNCAGMELYRRRIASYEDAKCILNGEIYG